MQLERLCWLVVLVLVLVLILVLVLVLVLKPVLVLVLVLVLELVTCGALNLNQFFPLMARKCLRIASSAWGKRPRSSVSGDENMFDAG